MAPPASVEGEREREREAHGFVFAFKCESTGTPYISTTRTFSEHDHTLHSKLGHEDHHPED
jgi:hypothetical protein